MRAKVIINGSFGKMGRLTQGVINQTQDFELIANLGKNDLLAETIQRTKADIVIDFTTPYVVFTNARTIIEAGARPVIGTTGLKSDEIQRLQVQCDELKRGGIIAPNFSVGAILMMRYAADAAKYFNDVEIIEMHHPQKLDKPSGTALKTAEMIENAKKPNNKKINIHSVRLPGLFSHQRVLFGGDGETLSIQHDSTDRSAMTPGILLACRKVMELDRLIYGLENLI